MGINNEYLEDFKLDANDHGEPHWFIDRRIEVLKQLDSLDLAKSQYFNEFDDLVKITSPQRIRSKKDLIDAKNINDYTMTQFGQTTVKNGLPEELEEQGVILTDIFTALRIHPRLIQTSFMDKVISPDEDKMTAFHLACVNSGVFLYIPKGVKISQPISINLIQDDTRPTDLNTHVLVVAEGDAEVSIEQNLSNYGKNNNRTNFFVEVLARANAKVNYSLNSESSSNFIYTKTRAYLGRDSSVNWNFNLNNHGNTWADLSNNLYGSGSRVKTVLNSQTNDKQIEEITTATIKHGKNVASELENNLISKDNSVLTLNGQKS
ncbi:SufD family Fe-S cluster assembly protein [Companilactobacillus sp. HBUAS59699]|uniref:SufD family Fe-S cluster assembly protein n=1 Tax=Companilactobacillus sp. HBUAS59699 TaxID=3109358 RepID=UPI002FF0CF0C